MERSVKFMQKGKWRSSSAASSSCRNTSVRAFFVGVRPSLFEFCLLRCRLLFCLQVSPSLLVSPFLRWSLAFRVEIFSPLLQSSSSLESSLLCRVFSPSLGSSLLYGNLLSFVGVFSSSLKFALLCHRVFSSSFEGLPLFVRVFSESSLLRMSLSSPGTCWSCWSNGPVGTIDSVEPSRLVLLVLFVLLVQFILGFAAHTRSHKSTGPTGPTGATGPTEATSRKLFPSPRRRCNGRSSCAHLSVVSVSIDKVF